MQHKNDIFFISELFAKFGINHGFGARSYQFGELSKKNIIPVTKQVHGTEIHLLNTKNSHGSYVGDAYLTSDPGILCYVRTADCLPLLLCDLKTRNVGAVHAGWRGISAHIVRKAIDRFVERGSDPADILAAIGPRIRQRCYNVGSDMKAEMIRNEWKTCDLFFSKGGVLHFSMSKAVHSELIECGIHEENIDILPHCTFCDEKNFHSYRRDPKTKGRQINFIYL